MTFAEMAPILAQAGGGGGGTGGDGEAVAVLAGMACYGVLLIAAIVLGIMFLLTLYRALNECAPENRTMEPGQVWLTFIPLVGIVFGIMAIFKVPDSLANEYRDRGIRTDSDFGKSAALWYILGYFICAPVGLVFWIIYWVKIAGHVKELRERRGASRREDDEEDDRPSKRRSKYADDEEDERPSKRRRRDEDDDEDEDDRPSKRRRRDDD